MRSIAGSFRRSATESGVHLWSLRCGCRAIACFFPHPATNARQLHIYRPGAAGFEFQEPGSRPAVSPAACGTAVAEDDRTGSPSLRPCEFVLFGTAAAAATTRPLGTPGQQDAMAGSQQDEGEVPGQRSKGEAEKGTLLQLIAEEHAAGGAEHQPDRRREAGSAHPAGRHDGTRRSRHRLLLSGSPPEQSARLVPALDSSRPHAGNFLLNNRIMRDRRSQRSGFAR